MEETKKEISLESEADTLLNSINSLSEYQIDLKQEEHLFKNDDELKKIRKKYKQLFNELSNQKVKHNYAEKFDSLLTTFSSLSEKYLSHKANYLLQKGEYDKQQQDFNKLNQQKTVLENFFKSLQKQAQDKYDEHEQMLNYEKGKRSEFAEKFKAQVSEIQVRLDDKTRERMQRLKENEILKEKLKEISEQFEKANQLYDAILKKKDLEMEMQILQFQEKLNQIQFQSQNIEQFHKELEESKKKEELLQVKVKVYTDKSEQFQTIMKQSNQIFDQFQKFREKVIDLIFNISKIIKKINQIENDNHNLQNKCEKNDIAAVEMIEQYQSLKQEESKLKSQINVLNNLAETLKNKINALPAN